MPYYDDQLGLGYFSAEPEVVRTSVPQAEVTVTKTGLAIPSTEYLIPLGIAAALLIYIRSK